MFSSMNNEYGNKRVGASHLSIIFLLFVEGKEVERKRQVGKTEGAGRTEDAGSGLLSEVLR